MLRKFVERIRSQEAHTMIEYALMLVLIAIVCVAVVTSIGLKANNMFNSAASSGAWTP